MSKKDVLNMVLPLKKFVVLLWGMTNAHETSIKYKNNIKLRNITDKSILEI